ncbi:MAG: hypothetical protein ABI120_05620, partial [Gemmatimonadaceae bacterium]
RTADVRIMALDGTVVVEGWDRDSVDVTGTVAKGMTPFFGGSRSGFKVATYEGITTAGTRADVIVRVPRQARVWVKTTLASVAISGLGSNIDVYTIGGSIRIRGAPDALVAESMRGPIEVAGTPGWVRLKNGSGIVRLSDVNARDISVSTVIGPITGTIGAQRVRLETMSGAITTTHVLVPESMTDIDTHDGPVTVRGFEVGGKRQSVGLSVRIYNQRGSVRNGWTLDQPSRLAGTGSELAFGAGNAALVIRTFSGEVKLVEGR